jgi:hypothetical protein
MIEKPVKFIFGPADGKNYPQHFVIRSICYRVHRLFIIKGA